MKRKRTNPLSFLYWTLVWHAPGQTLKMMCRRICEARMGEQEDKTLIFFLFCCKRQFEWASGAVHSQAPYNQKGHEQTTEGKKWLKFAIVDAWKSSEHCTHTTGWIFFLLCPKSSRLLFYTAPESHIFFPCVKHTVPKL